MNDLLKLIAIGSSQLGSSGPEILGNDLMADVYENVLSRKNGFFAFESSLLVRPLHTCQQILGVFEWNRDSCWKYLYKDDLSQGVFFAENIFGESFVRLKSGIFTFNPETADFETFALDFDEWASKILDDPELHLGSGIAHDWQAKNGALRVGERLGPKVPFVLGGDFEVTNLERSNEIDLIKFRSQIANQISSLPDGSEVKIDIVG